MSIRTCIAAAALALTAGVASAASIAWTEGLRPDVPGTMRVPTTDASNTAPGFDLGTLNSAGDTIDIFGRIVENRDFYTVSSVKPFRVDFIVDGFQPDSQMMDKTATFSLLQGGMTVFSFDFTTTQGPILIAGGIAPGSYTFLVDGTASAFDALYDVRFTAVPLPASAWMLLCGLAGVVYVSRRRA